MEYFSSNEFNFDTDNVKNLHNKLEMADKQLFAFDMGQLNWHELFYATLVGLRLYMVKDDPSTIPESIKRHRWYGMEKHQLYLSIAFLIPFLVSA